MAFLHAYIETLDKYDLPVAQVLPLKGRASHLQLYVFKIVVSRCSSMVEHMLTMCKALDSSPAHIENLIQL